MPAHEWSVFDNCGICPTCRRVTPASRPCDLDATVVRPIASADDKQALVDAVWGPAASRAELMRQLSARTGPRARTLSTVGYGAIGMAVAAVVGQTDTSIEVIVGVATAAFGFLASGARGKILLPSGAAAIAAQPRFAAGVIQPCERVVAPGSGAACAAWALELRYDGRWGSRTTLRIGASAGFDVALDGGELLRIPAGPLWVQDALPQLADLEGPSLEQLLRALDPTRTSDADPWPVFRFNVVVEQSFQIGDRIEILGAVERELDAAHKHAMYRDAAASVLVPRGVPTLRRIPR